MRTFLNTDNLWLPSERALGPARSFILREVFSLQQCCRALLLASCCVPAGAQQVVASLPVSDAKVTGAVEIQGSRMLLSSGSSIAAGERGAILALTRGGQLDLCANSAVHIASGAHPGEMMLSLDRGAMELHSPLQEFSDVVITPDLRLLLSGPATANVSIRTGQQGDTCVDNAGQDAPYVTVTEQLGSGVYRVQSGQRVMFEHGSMEQVVDNEKESCGCPSPLPSATPTTSTPASGPDFPLAQSEGLAPPSPAPKEPAVPPGQVHAQITIPFVYNGSQPLPPQPQPTPPAPTQPPTPPAAAPPNSQGTPDLWTGMKHLWHHMFGKKKNTQ